MELKWTGVLNKPWTFQLNRTEGCPSNDRNIHYVCYFARFAANELGNPRTSYCYTSSDFFYTHLQG